MPSLRPPLLLAVFLVGLPGSLPGADTARQAFEHFVRSVPTEVSGQVVAILGFNGDTEPETWTFLTKHPKEDEALLEYQVRDGNLRGPSLIAAGDAPDGLERPLPPGVLPVDSHDVARIVDDAAILQGLEFSRIDYQLCWREEGPEPLWMATLVGDRSETLGHFFISSQSGEVTHRSFYHDFPRLPPVTASAVPAPAETPPGSPRGGSEDTGEATQPPAQPRDVAGTRDPRSTPGSRPGLPLFRKGRLLPFGRKPDADGTGGSAPDPADTGARQEERRRPRLPPLFKRR